MEFFLTDYLITSKNITAIITADTIKNAYIVFLVNFKQRIVSCEEIETVCGNLTEFGKIRVILKSNKIS